MFHSLRNRTMRSLMLRMYLTLSAERYSWRVNFCLFLVTKVEKKICELATFVLNILSFQSDKPLIDPDILLYNNPNEKLMKYLFFYKVARVDDDGGLKSISFVNIWVDIMYGNWSFIDIWVLNYYYFLVFTSMIIFSHGRFFNGNESLMRMTINFKHAFVVLNFIELVATLLIF